MRHLLRPALVLAIIAPLLVSCGEKKEDEDEPAPVVYATMTIADSKATTDNGTSQLTTLDSCKRDVASGLVTVKMSMGAGKASLSFSIKNYSSTPKAYTCTQAVDNQVKPELGTLYETCMVDVKVPASATDTALNGYSMYRETVTTEGFIYAGACAIDVTAATPAIQGTIACTDLIQTTRNGTPPNPLVATVTADVTGSFNCTFK